MASRHSFLYRLALHIHDLLDIPLDRHGDPAHGFKIIKATFDAMARGLRAGEEVSIRGFGKLCVVERTPRRTGSNFARQSQERYGAPLQYLPKRTVIFIPSEQVKAMLNNGTTWDEKRAMEIW
jgi:nucleoid DNA-binding protein